MASDKKESDLSRAFSEDGALKTHVGGQALLEGVMMRGKFNWAVAVRTPEGDIYTEEHDLASGKKHAWMRWPFVRGCVALVQSLILGFKALEIAANHAYDDEEEEAAEGKSAATALEEAQGNGKSEISDAAAANDFEQAGGQNAEQIDVQRVGQESERDATQTAEPESEQESEQDADQEKEPFFGKAEMAISMGLGLLLGVGLFIVAPAFITNFIVGEYDASPVAWNIVDGLIRVAVFVLYIWMIGRMSDIKRMFSYHGAEHKTIHCFEHGLPLTPENARRFPCLHVRCGTAFLIMVMIIAIFVYTAIPLSVLFGAWGVPDGAPKLALVILTRIVFMPVIAGISYEITVKWAGTHPENSLVKVILWPGLQMQRLTTNEPDDSMLECAIAAMQLVLDREAEEAHVKK